MFIGVHPWLKEDGALPLALRRGCKPFSFPKKPRAGAFYLQNRMSTINPSPREKSHEEAGFLERTFTEHQAPLTRYAAKLLNDHDRARDVVQDVFAKLMAQPVAEIEGHVAEWLFTVCRHRAFDVLRKEGRMKHFEEGQAERVTATEPRPGHALEAAETQAAILKLIEVLPKNQQEVIRLKFQNGFSYKEISRITSLSVTNVGFLIHTAVARLRTEMSTQRS